MDLKKTPPLLAPLLLAAGLLAGCATPPGPSLPPQATPAPAPASSRFIRPADGKVVARFNGNTNKGIDIAGKAGDAVRAAANGRVVYVGDELRKFGNLIIVDHGDNFLTAYAYNKLVLVQEKQAVSQGQKIAEMGASPEGQAMLHFEIRKQGVAVDPEPYLNGKLN